MKVTADALSSAGPIGSKANIPVNTVLKFP